MCLSAIPLIGKAQGQVSLEKGDVLINPAITLGWYNYGYNLDVVNILPPVALNFEYAVHDLFSVGLEAEYGQRSYRDLLFLTGTNTYKYEYKGLSLRGSFHYLDLLKNLFGDDLGALNSDKIDFYVGASTGILITTYTSTWISPTDGLEHKQKSFNSNGRFGYMAGFRYYFNDHFGAFLETGKNSLGWAKVGLTIKF